jgi:hypothetical protein
MRGPVRGQSRNRWRTPGKMQVPLQSKARWHVKRDWLKYSNITRRIERGMSVATLKRALGESGIGGIARKRHIRPLCRGKMVAERPRKAADVG